MSDLGQRRRHARERALELAYEASMKERAHSDILSDLALAPDPYTVEILLSCEENRERIETLISEFSLKWTLDRLAIIDRLILTLALGELLATDPPPTAVVLNEAIELAKTFSTESSATFVNGVLAACVEHLE